MSFKDLRQLQQETKAKVRTLCELFDVSRSGFYTARKSVELPKPRPLTALVRTEFERSQGCYGKRRIAQAINGSGVRVGVHAVAAEMKKLDLTAIWYKRKYVVTTDSNHVEPVFENVLDRNFSPAAPNQAWVSDITYIWTQTGWVYLAVVLDLCGRKVVGWAMDRRMEATLVCRALHMAIQIRAPELGLIVHSDRGSQYASEAYRALLAAYGCVGSMSRKGNCWDNAAMERFFLSLKTERVWRRTYANQHEAVADVGDYIVNFYNEKRLHSAIGYMTPNQFEQQFDN
jgi:putative transposase